MAVDGLVRARRTLLASAAIALLGGVGVAAAETPDIAQRVCDPGALTGSCPVIVPVTTAPSRPAALTARELERYARAAGTRVYWAGPEQDATYEYRTGASRGVLVRYLHGRRVAFLTIATAPLPDAFGIVRTYAGDPGSVRVQNAEPRSVAFYSRAKPTTVYLAFAGSNYEITVTAPAPGAAIAVARSGRVRPVA